MNLKKTYLIILLIGIIVIAIFAYLSLAVLQKSMEPLEIVDKYHIYRSFLTQGTFLFFLLLMIFSNLIYLKRSKGGSFIISGLFFIAFTLLDYLSVRKEFFAFRQSAGLSDGKNTITLIAGVLISLVVIVIVVANYIMIKRHKQRLESRKELNEKDPDDVWEKE